MTTPNPSDEIKIQMDIENGSHLILIDRLAMEARFGKVECARNVYLISSSGEVIWQIRTDFDEEGNPFTGLTRKNEYISAYRWDGGSYSINMTSGFAKPRALSR